MAFHLFGPTIRPLDRIQTPVNAALEIEFYGLRNLYPQKQDNLRLASPLVKTATEVLADFVNGSGFESNGDAVLNEDGHLADDLLNLVAMDYATYNGFALFVGFDGTGVPTEIRHVPFEFCRYNLPDATGRHSRIAVSNDWERIQTKEDYQSFQIFNPLTAADEVITGGNGQILYFTGQVDKYALSTFDSINNTAETDAEIQLYERNNSKKGFNGTTIFRYPGNYESESEQREITRKIQGMQGADSPGIFVAQVDEDFTGSLLETIPPNNTDALFSLTRQAIIDRVLQVYKIPPALMGINPQGGVFTQQAYKDSFITYNVITRNRRKSISRIFNTVGSLMGLEFGQIKENQYVVNAPGTGVEENTRQTSGRSDEELQAQANLRGSVGGVQGILSIQLSVSQGVTNYDSAITLLIEVFGFDQATSRELLGSEEDIKRSLENPPGEGSPAAPPEAKLKHIYNAVAS